MAEKKTYTIEDIQGMAKGIIKPFIAETSGLLDKVPTAMRPGIQKVYDQMNEFLSTLAPIEQVPAAQQAGWAMESLAYSLARFGEMTDGIMAQLKGIIKENGTVCLELNGLKERVTKGDLIEKGAVQASITQAQAEALDKLWPEIIGQRKMLIETCGLPEPLEAVLKLPHKDFEAALTQARANAGELEKKGMKGKGNAWVVKAAWQSATEFSGSMTLINELHPGTGPAKPAADPLLGAPPAEGGKAKRAVLGVC